MKFKSVKAVMSTVGLSALCAFATIPGIASSVPSLYSKDYAALDNAIDTFVTSLDNRPQCGNHRLGATLNTANAGRGLSLLKSTTMTEVRQEIASFRLLGMDTVTVNASFPLGCDKFWSQNMQGKSNPKAVMAFYQSVVKQCHDAGMRVHVTTAPPNPNSDNTFAQACQNYAMNLSPAQYEAAYAEHISNIASLVQPNAVSALNSPGGMLDLTGQMVYQSPATSATFVQHMVSQVAAANTKNGTKVLVTAGAAREDFLAAFAKVPGLTALEFGINFAGGKELEHATALADYVRSLGKPLVISECWLDKTGIGVPPSKGIGAEQGEIESAQDSFSFWEPLDCKFAAAMKKFVRVEDPAIFTFSNTDRLYAYLNYGAYANSSNVAINSAEGKAAFSNLQQQQYSATGLRIGELNL